MAVEEKVLSGPDFAVRCLPDGKYALTLEIAGRTRFRLGRLAVGEFSELGALPKKLRLHRTGDALSGSFETAAVIPFGNEFLVERDIEFCDGFGQSTVDVSAVNHGAVGDLALGDVFFEGPWKRLEFLLFGETAFRRVETGDGETEFYRGAEIPLMVRLVSDDGVRVEFATGCDLWRHRAAFRTPGTRSEFALTGGAGQVIFERRVLSYAADVEIEKRPWRFTNLFAWSSGATRSAASPSDMVFDLAAAKLPETARRTLPGGGDAGSPCLTGAGSRRFLRDLIRRNRGAVELTGAAPGLCFAAGHLERPGKGELEHLDLEDYLNFYLWGNRQLARSGGSLRMTSRGTGLFDDSVCVANLARIPRALRQD